MAFRSALPCQPRCPPSEFLPGGPALPSPASISSIHLPSLPPPAWRERMAEREKGATSPAGSSPFLGLHLASPPNFRYRSLPPPQTPQALSRGPGGGFAADCVGPAPSPTYPRSAEPGWAQAAAASSAPPACGLLPSEAGNQAAVPAPHRGWAREGVSPPFALIRAGTHRLHCPGRGPGWNNARLGLQPARSPRPAAGSRQCHPPPRPGGQTRCPRPQLRRSRLPGKRWWCLPRAVLCSLEGAGVWGTVSPGGLCLSPCSPVGRAGLWALFSLLALCREGLQT